MAGEGTGQAREPQEGTDGPGEVTGGADRPAQLAEALSVVSLAAAALPAAGHPSCGDGQSGVSSSERRAALCSGKWEVKNDRFSGTSLTAAV